MLNDEESDGEWYKTVEARADAAEAERDRLRAAITEVAEFCGRLHRIFPDPYDPRHRFALEFEGKLRAVLAESGTSQLRAALRSGT